MESSTSEDVYEPSEATTHEESDNDNDNGGGSSSSSSSSEIDSPRSRSPPPRRDNKRRASSLNPPGGGGPPDPKKPRYGYYNKGYHELFNGAIRDATARALDEDREVFGASRIGASLWSGAEKERFFRALDRRGRDDVRGIAAAVGGGTKAEAEVEAYVRLLQAGSLRRSKSYPVDHVAAAEVSRKCRIALDDAAEGLAARQLAWEESLETRKYGSLWRVGETTNLRRILQEQKEGAGPQLPEAADIGRIQAAAELLNTKRMLGLSRTIFMNSSDPEYNYRTYSEQDLPHIQMTALLDFYNLTLMVTRRIVATARFLALSRIKRGRNSRGESYLKSFVRLGDVVAAIKTLAMEKPGESWLVKSIRSNKIEVYEPTDKKAKPKLIPDHMLEKRLIRRRTRKQMRNIGKQPVVLAGGKGESVSKQDTSDDDSSDSAEFVIGEAHEEAPAESDELIEDGILETLDQNQSREEERLLWLTLGLENETETADETDIEEGPRLSSRTVDFPEDWRLFTKYQSTWERFHQPVLEEQFERNRQRMSLSQAAAADSAYVAGVRDISASSKKDRRSDSEDEEDGDEMSHESATGSEEDSEEEADSEDASQDSEST